MSNPSSQRELEIKIALPDEEAYERLFRHLSPAHADVKQRNCFLDTPDRHLSSVGWALRIRREDPRDRSGAQLFITAKGPSRRLAGAVDRPELEQEASPELWDAVGAGEVDCDALDGSPMQYLRQTFGLTGVLRPILSFGNRRTTFLVPLGGRQRSLLLDRTTFDTGQVDFEIEVELELSATSPPALAALDVRAVEADLRQLLKRTGINPLPPQPGKFARARAYAQI